MAERDEKGYIHYSPEELNQIPSFEQRTAGTTDLSRGQTGLLGGAAGTVAGAAVGSAFGPAGTVAGGVAGATLGGSAGVAAGQAAKKPDR